MSVQAPVGAVQRRTGHFGAWRALTSVPAMVGSVLLLVVLFGWLGKWEGAVLLGWIGAGAAVFTGVGERVAVRVGAGFRRPTNAQFALLAPAWAAALARAGLGAGEVDLYVQRSCEPNAFATGGRSVAVTTDLLAKFQARRLGEERLVAILTHEFAHIQTRATKFALITAWLATPWRFASRLMIGIGLATVGRRQPLGLLGMVVLTGVVVAVGQVVQQRQWMAAVVLSSLAVCAVVCPLADAAVSRRSEYAADMYAARVGVGPQLAGALQALSGEQRRRGLIVRLLSHHPAVCRRIQALSGVPGRA